MAKRRPTNSQRTTASPTAAKRTNAEPLEMKPWTFLLYFCGDTGALEEFVEKDVAKVADACLTNLGQVHVVLQHDSPKGGAKRYVGSGGQWIPQNPNEPVRVNTGDPQEAIDFLTWGLKHAPSRHVAVFFSGQGIRKKYAEEIRKQRDLFERCQSAADNKSDSAFGMRDLFSICHDESHHDALDVAELQHILQATKTLLDRPVDLVVFDAGCTAFFEIAYQLRSVARVMLAPRGPMPDAGLPYYDLLVSCDKVIQESERLEQTLSAQDPQSDQEQSNHPPNLVAIALSEAIGQATVSKYERADQVPELVAVDLQHMVAAAEHIDYVAGTLQSHLGDWHVLKAVRRTVEFVDLMQSLNRDQLLHHNTNLKKEDLADLPAADLFRFLCLLEAHLER
jgi:hypothetical protein